MATYSLQPAWLQFSPPALETVGEKLLVGSNADDEGTAEASADDEAGKARADHGQTVGALQTR